MTCAPAHRLTLLCGLLTAGALLAGVIGADVSGAGTSRFDKRCRPTGSRLVAANQYARVYYDNAEAVMAYCLPGRSEAEYRSETIFPPPAISLVGPYLGYGSNVNEGVSGSEQVQVEDVRGSGRSDFFRDIAGAGVGSLKVNRRGSVAWIECPWGDIEEPGKLSCGNPSDQTRSVYRHDSRSTEQEPVQLLARGTSIKLRSLRRKRSRIYWTENGKTRSASLR